MESGCPECFTKETVEKFGSKEIYEKFQRFEKNFQVDADPNLMWCSKPGCPHFIEKEKGKVEQTCECGQKVCMKCGAMGHGKTRCSNVGDADLEKWTKGN